MSSLESSPFSTPYNALVCMGAWNIITSNKKILKIYSAYQIIILGNAALGIAALVADLFTNFDDLEKLTWNLCVTTLFTMAVCKHLIIFSRHKTINNLRERLHEEEQSKVSKEDRLLQQSAIREFHFIRRLPYFGIAICFPIWAFLHYQNYLQGSRNLPLPVRVPFPVNTNDLSSYITWFIIHIWCSLVGFFFVIEEEMVMFSLLLQISREYAILLKDIFSLNVTLEDGSLKETNSILRKCKTKLKVKELAHRQQKLIRLIFFMYLIFCL